MLEGISLGGYDIVVNILIGAIGGFTAITLLGHDFLLVGTEDEFSLLEEVIECDSLFVRYSSLESGVTGIRYSSEDLWLLNFLDFMVNFAQSSD